MATDSARQAGELTVEVSTEMQEAGLSGNGARTATLSAGAFQRRLGAFRDS